MLCGDAELNPGPRQNTAKNPSLEPYSIAAHIFGKLILFKAYNSVYKFHVVYLSETYFDSNILPDDGDLEVPGYNIVCSIICQI